MQGLIAYRLLSSKYFWIAAIAISSSFVIMECSGTPSVEKCRMEAEEAHREYVRELNDNNAMLRTGDYISYWDRQSMQRNEETKGQIYAQREATCNALQRMSADDAEFDVLSRQFDLRRLRGYSESNLKAVLAAAGVPDDLRPNGPIFIALTGLYIGSYNEQLKILRALRQSPNLYK